jgi:hypothetical protein
VDVRTLVSELVEQAALAMWWDDLSRTIKLRVLRAVSTNATVLDASNILEGSLQTKDQPSKRITEVWTYYGQIDPTKGVDRADNFRSTLATLALQVETDYGASSIKTIYSRWIPPFGIQIAQRVNDIQIARYREPPRQITFELHRYGEVSPELGGAYKVGGWSIQDAFGLPALAPVQITRLNALNDRYQVEAEEALYDASSSTTVDLLNRVITIDGNVNNINLRTIHDTLYPAPVGGASPQIVVSCIVSSGVTVGSSDIASPAFDVGSWPADVPVTLDIRGRIQGKGGKGGDTYGTTETNPATAGGTALKTARAISVKYGAGARVWGGGGGGAGQMNLYIGRSPGGGGGAGTDAGLGGNGVGEVTAAQNGTDTAGGLGGAITGASPAVNGGKGGDPGQPGGICAPAGSGGVAGAAGKAIDGNAFITVLSGSADIRGTVV